MGHDEALLFEQHIEKEARRLAMNVASQLMRAMSEQGISVDELASLKAGAAIKQ